jgi:hypothetical protein
MQEFTISHSAALPEMCEARKPPLAEAFLSCLHIQNYFDIVFEGSGFKFLFFFFKRDHISASSTGKFKINVSFVILSLH